MGVRLFPSETVLFIVHIFFFCSSSRNKALHYQYFFNQMYSFLMFKSCACKCMMSYHSMMLFCACLYIFLFFIFHKCYYFVYLEFFRGKEVWVGRSILCCHLGWNISLLMRARSGVLLFSHTSENSRDTLTNRLILKIFYFFLSFLKAFFPFSSPLKPSCSLRSTLHFPHHKRIGLPSTKHDISKW